MLSRSFAHVTDDDIRIMAAGDGITSGQFSSAQVATQMAQDQIFSLSPGIEWFREFVLTLFKWYTLPVLNYLGASKEFGAIFKTGFQFELGKRFKELLARQLNQVVDIYGLDVKRIASMRPLQLVSRHQMLPYMVPLENVIPTDDMLMPQKVVVNKPNSLKIEIEQQGTYLPPVHTERETMEPLKRTKEKLQAFNQIAEHARDNSGIFNVADLVEGWSRIFIK